MKNCTICGKPIILVPSAESRAKAFGQTPEYYENLFSEHGECTVFKREQDTLDLIKRIQDESTSSPALGNLPDGLRAENHNLQSGQRSLSKGLPRLRGRSTSGES